jgi:hypothetical protein
VSAGTLAGPAVALLAIAAAVAAALAVRRTAQAPAARAGWWLAAVAAGGGAVIGARGEVPMAAAVSAAGLAAASVVDAVEGRIPTVVAHGTSLVSGLALLAWAAAGGHWDELAETVGLTAVLAIVLAALWAFGLAGFGDVRLTGAVASGLVPGPGALVVVVAVAALGAGVAASYRIVGAVRDRHTAGRVPLAPPLALGWLASMAFT